MADDVDGVVQERRKVFGEWLEQQQNDYPGRFNEDRPSDRSIAKAVGITATHYGLIKKGATGTKRAVIVKIAQALRLDESTVLDMAGLAAGAPSEPEVRLGRTLTQIIGQAPPEKRSALEAALIRDAQNYVSLLVPNAA